MVGYNKDGPVAVKENTVACLEPEVAAGGVAAVVVAVTAESRKCLLSFVGTYIDILFLFLAM